MYKPFFPALKSPQTRIKPSFYFSKLFIVGKYISLEAKIAQSKDLYHDALSRSQNGWHEGCEDGIPFIKYLLGIILAAYKNFEDRFSIVETRLPAVDMVRKAAQNKIGRFNTQHIRGDARP